MAQRVRGADPFWKFFCPFDVFRAISSVTGRRAEPRFAKSRELEGEIGGAYGIGCVYGSSKEKEHPVH